MNFKQIGIVLSFLLVGSIPKAMAHIQAYLIIDKVVFGIGKKFMTPNHKITSNNNKMGHSDCISSFGGSPVWRIENDSLFLTKIIIGYNEIPNVVDEYTEVIADLSKEFGSRYVNGRVFAKELTTEIIASRADGFENDSIGINYNDNLCFLTVKNGKISKHIEFTGTTHWPMGYLLSDVPNISNTQNKPNIQSKDWYTQPEMPLNGGTKVAAKILIDDNGKVTKVEITEGDDKRWNKLVIKVINFLSSVQSVHISHVYYYTNMRRKKDKVVFIVKKPR